MRPRRVLALIPAHNERDNLPVVVGALRRRRPDADVLVVDDGSSDDTLARVVELGVGWLHWPERRGVGRAVRAGLRYAARQGYDVVVRLDADGQHDVDDIDRLLAPVTAGTADAALGSRFCAANRLAPPGPIRRSLGLALSMITGRDVTDPTSGFWALGPRAVAMLAEHHPGGYPEPELHLLLSRNALRVVEVSIHWRARLHGRTSLTPMRLAAAAARTVLAMIIVPLRASLRVPRV